MKRVLILLTFIALAITPAAFADDGANPCNPCNPCGQEQPAGD